MCQYSHENGTSSLQQESRQVLLSRRPDVTVGGCCTPQGVDSAPWMRASRQTAVMEPRRDHVPTPHWPSHFRRNGTRVSIQQPWSTYRQAFRQSHKYYSTQMASGPPDRSHFSIRRCVISCSPARPHDALSSPPIRPGHCPHRSARGSAAAGLLPTGQ